MFAQSVAQVLETSVSAQWFDKKKDANLKIDMV